METPKDKGTNLKGLLHWDIFSMKVRNNVIRYNILNLKKNPEVYKKTIGE